MNKQILSLFLLSLPLTSLLAQNKFKATAQEYGFKGPVKTCKFNGYYLHDVVEVTFNKNGDLIEGKTYYEPEELQDLFTTTFDSHGNKTQMKHCNYELKCPDCESLIKKEEANATAVPADDERVVLVEAGGSNYIKCKNKPDYVKQQIKQVDDFFYNSKNQLVKTVSASSSDNYDERVVEYEYDNQGNKTLVYAYKKSKPERKDTTYLSKNGLLLKDAAYNYIYNDKNQLVERTWKGCKDIKTLFTYYDNGKLKTAINSGRGQDTLYCNTNGDTLKLVDEKGWMKIAWFDNSVNVGYAGFHTLAMEYGKNNVKTSKKLYDNANKVVYEEVYDKNGQWVKKIFKDGYIERTFDKKKKTETQNLYLNGLLRSVANIKEDALYVTSYNDKGEISNTLIEKRDKYGNVVKRNSGNGFGSLKTYEFTYFE